LRGRRVDRFIAPDGNPASKMAHAKTRRRKGRKRRYRFGQVARWWVARSRVNVVD